MVTSWRRLRLNLPPMGITTATEYLDIGEEMLIAVCNRPISALWQTWTDEMSVWIYDQAALESAKFWMAYIFSPAWLKRVVDLDSKAECPGPQGQWIGENHENDPRTPVLTVSNRCPAMIYRRCDAWHILYFAGTFHCSFSVRFTGSEFSFDLVVLWAHYFFAKAIRGSKCDCQLTMVMPLLSSDLKQRNLCFATIKVVRLTARIWHEEPSISLLSIRLSIEPEW